MVTYTFLNVKVAEEPILKYRVILSIVCTLISLGNMKAFPKTT